jgi:hypothetical protein
MMNLLKLRSKIYPKLYPLYILYMKMIGVPMHLPYHADGQEASDLVKNALLGDKPCMVCRFGSLELQVMVAYLNQTEIKNPFKKVACLLRGEPLNYNSTLKGRFSKIAGFFPAEEKYMDRFSELMIEDSKCIDILGVWRTEQARIAKFFPQATNVPLDTLEAYTFDSPWTEALRGKKVLVVHPFVETIKSQYAKRELIFKNKNILPEFELKTLKAVQSAADSDVGYDSWFDALSYMCDEISKIDFDIAIIGAGAYGFPLAAHVKRLGRKAVHMGGVSQLLFGIKGNRWDANEYYKNLYNEHWIRPSQPETPKSCTKVEGGSYW